MADYLRSEVLAASLAGHDRVPHPDVGARPVVRAAVRRRHGRGRLAAGPRIARELEPAARPVGSSARVVPLPPPLPRPPASRARSERSGAHPPAARPRGGHGSRRTAIRSWPSTTPRPPVTPIGPPACSPASLRRPTRPAGWTPSIAGSAGSRPAGLIERYPQVAVLGAFAEAMVGHPAGAERWADAAESGPFDGLLPDGSSIDGWIAVLDAALCRRGVARMRADAELACDRLLPGSRWGGPAWSTWRCPTCSTGTTTPRRPDPGRAPSRSASVPVVMATAAPALAERAVVAIERHDWSAADAFAEDALAIVRDAHLDGYLVATLVHAVAARTAVHRGDVSQAKEHVARPVGCARCAAPPSHSPPSSCCSWPTPI